MSIFKPETSGRGGSWLGFQEVAITGIADRKTEPALEWADVALDIHLEAKEAKYENILSILGTFEKDDKGFIQTNTLTKKIFYFCEAIGFQGGVNTKGDWVTEKEEPIKNIAEYLNEHFLKKDYGREGIFPYFTYIYKHKNPKNEKVYSRVYIKIVRNTTDEIMKFKDYISFCKSKGYLVEEP